MSLVLLSGSKLEKLDRHVSIFYAKQRQIEELRGGIAQNRRNAPRTMGKKWRRETQTCRLELPKRKGVKVTKGERCGLLITKEIKSMTGGAGSDTPGEMKAKQ